MMQQGSERTLGNEEEVRMVILGRNIKFYVNLLENTKIYERYMFKRVVVV